MCVKSVVTGCMLEIDTEDKAAVAEDVTVVTEGVVAVLDVSEVGQEVQVGVTEVSGVSVCVVVVGEVIADVSKQRRYHKVLRRRCILLFYVEMFWR